MKTIYNLVKKIIAYNAAIESIIHKNEETVNERYYKMYRPEFLEDRWKTENIIETILEWKENGNNYNDIISSIYYTAEKEVENLSDADRRLAKNEIYARHGRMFDSADLQDYFESKSWYKGTVKPSDFDESVLNKYEKANIDLISSME